MSEGLGWAVAPGDVVGIAAALSDGGSASWPRWPEGTAPSRPGATSRCLRPGPVLLSRWSALLDEVASEHATAEVGRDRVRHHRRRSAVGHEHAARRPDRPLRGSARGTATRSTSCGSTATSTSRTTSCPVERATPRLSGYLHRPSTGSGVARTATSSSRRHARCRCGSLHARPLPGGEVRVHPSGRHRRRRHPRCSGGTRPSSWATRCARPATSRRLDFPRHVAALGAQAAVTQRLRGECERTDRDLRVGTWWGPRPHDFRELQRAPPPRGAGVRPVAAMRRAGGGRARRPPRGPAARGASTRTSWPTRAGGTARFWTSSAGPRLLATTDTARSSSGSVGKGREPARPRGGGPPRGAGPGDP